MPMRRLWMPRYAASPLACLGALGASLLLTGITPTAPFPLFLAAVAFSTWRGGLASGLVATSLSLLLINYFFETPVYSLAITDLSTVVDLAVFVGAALLINTLDERLREAQRKIEAARADAETMQWLEFLAESGTVLGRSLDKQATLQAAAVLGARELADWCVLHIVRPDGTLALRTLAHKCVDRDGFLAELRDCLEPAMNLALGVTDAVRGRRAVVQETMSDAALASAVRDAGRLRAFRELGLRSSMCVPLESRGQLLGTMTFVSGDVAGYGQIHLKKARDLAARVALALENARLHRQDIERARMEGAFRAARRRESALTGHLAALRAQARLLAADPDLPDRVAPAVAAMLQAAEAVAETPAESPGCQGDQGTEGGMSAA